MTNPCLIIDCGKILENAKNLYRLVKLKGVEPVFVMKLLQSDYDFCSWFAKTVQRTLGIHGLNLAESQPTRLHHLKLPGAFVHQLRLSSKTQIPVTLSHASVSIESEMETIEALNVWAQKNQKIHEIMLACDAGDKREGVNPEDVLEISRQIQNLDHIHLRGITTNFGCFSGYIPDCEAMNEHLRWMSNLRESLKRPDLVYSLGNTSSLPWLLDYQEKITGPTEIRLGESLFLGLESTTQNQIEGLFTDAFLLEVEVLESIVKTNLPPDLKLGPNGFKETPTDFVAGSSSRLLLGLGRQDCDYRGLIPPKGLQILGSSSDYLVVLDHDRQFMVGDTIRLRADYKAVMGLFRSPEVEKLFKYPQEN